MDKTMRLSSTVMEVWRLKDNGVIWPFGVMWRDDVSCTVNDAVGKVICRHCYLRCEKKETKKQLNEYRRK